MVRSRILSVLLGVTIAGGVVLLLVAAWRGMRREQETADRIDAALVEQYCRAVAEGRCGEAYRECLTDKYRGHLSHDEFVAAQERRRSTTGILQSRKLLRVQATHSIVGGTTEYYLLYELRYPSGSERQYLTVSDEDGEFRISGTYSSSASDTLDFLVW